MLLADCPNCQQQHFTPEDTEILFRGKKSIVLTCPNCFASVEFLRDQLADPLNDSAVLINKPDGRPKSSVTHPGSSPIYWAAATNAPSLIERLVSNGADPSCRAGTSGATPLHLAASNKAHDAVKKLLELGSEVNVSIRGSSTPLELAAANSLPEIAQTLLQAREDRGIDDVPRGAMKEACENDFDDVLRVLLRSGVDPEIQLDIGGSALKHAARNGSHKAFSLLASNGAKIRQNERDYLLMSIKSKSILEYVLSSGVDPNIRGSPTSDTALHRAIGNKVAMNKLIEYGANVDVQDNRGKTPLHKALWTYKGWKHVPDKDFSEPKIDSIEILIKNGADPEIEDRKGFSPITKEVKKKQPFEVIKLLFNNGRSLNLQRLSKYDITDVMYGAINNGCPKIAKILLENGASVDGRIGEEDFESIEDGGNHGYKRPETTEEHLSLFGGVDRPELPSPSTDSYVREGYHWSPLQLAIEKNNKKLASLLLKNGASVEYEDWDGNTPLKMSKNNPEMRKLVINYKK